ncbi:MAG: SH3 domain-containing protein [Lachnospiraceae bacterium]|nr:SH3 domain-containing protein [Lachnospiraceae bacterium]
MKRFAFLLQHKSNSYILLCILLLFFFSAFTFSSFTIYAADLSTQPIESIPLPTEEAPNEPEADIPTPTEVPEDILTEETISPEPPAIENPIPEAPELPSDNIVAPVLPPIDDAPNPSTEESFIIEEFVGTYFVTSSGGLNVRSGPSIQYDIIGNLSYGEEISITGKVQNDWFEIPFQGTNGFISAKYLSAEPPSTLPVETEDLSETLESIIEEPVAKQESVPFVSDTTMLVLLAAIIAMILIIIATIISFFHNNHKYS